jgi:galactokinase
VSARDGLVVFAGGFGGEPAIVASAPGRVNLVGEHTDYNGGEVLPIAIARRTYVALRPNGGPRWRAASATQDARGEFDARDPARSGGWWDYVAGVVSTLRAGGSDVAACDIAVWSDVPAGAGLSSSAALEVAVGTALSELAGIGLARRDVALAGWKAENQFVGVASGIMDQFASALGEARHALHVWCDTAEVEQVPMPDAVLIFDTVVPRSLRGSAFNTRRAECDEALALLRRRDPALRNLAQADPAEVRAAKLPDPLDRRALHVSEETRRVGEAVAALKAGAPLPGELLLASHESLRTQYECSSPELDWFVERAMRAPGVRGARLTGAGWGGCAIAVGDEDALADAAPAIAADYERAFDRTPRTWLTRAAEGARIEGSAALSAEA